MKKVSIIVPVYNTEKYLEKCINSILQQTYKNIEIIVVNDGSTDNSKNVLNKKYKDNIILINQENKGLGGARNTGIKHASGDYIMFVDSDDYIIENSVEILLNTVSNAEIAIGNMNVHYEDNLLNKQNVKYIDNTIKYIESKKKNINIKNIKKSLFLTSACNKIYDLKFLKEKNILFPEQMKWEDNPFYVKCWVEAECIKITNKNVYTRIIRTDKNNKSITQNINLKAMIDDRSSYSIVFKFLEKKGRYDLIGLFLERYLSSTYNLFKKLQNNDINDGKKIVKGNKRFVLTYLNTHKISFKDSIKIILKCIYYSIKFKI
ncbi:glycosyltransferase family 2 protein [Clostridium perfringens]